MRYVSTRGTAPALAFEDVLLVGLADDGGLYVPDNWPHFDAREIASFAQASHPFVDDAVTSVTRATAIAPPP